MMSEHDKVRQKVTETYARAVKRGPSCCTPTVSKGTIETLAGYSSEELGNLAPDVIVSSFGCGNPVAFSEMKEGEVVLDMGSGPGIDLILAAKKVGPNGRVIGVDMTDPMIERARANVAAAGLRNVEVRKGIIEALPVESASVDWVISNCVINLSPEKERVFKEIARVLKPNGRMVVSDIMAQDLPDWARRSAALYTSCIGGAISEEEYLAGLQAAGMVEVEVRERLVYDANQLAAFATADDAAPSCCGGSRGGELRAEAANALAGKIWSARVHARRGTQGDQVL